MILCAGSDEQKPSEHRDGSLETFRNSADTEQAPGVISWIGDSALAVGQAAAVCAGNAGDAGALVYSGQSGMQFARLQQLHSDAIGRPHPRSLDGGTLRPQSPPGDHAGKGGATYEPESGSLQSRNLHGDCCRSLWLPTKPGKLDKHGLERQLPAALQFIDRQRKLGRSVLICDDHGADGCVCIALAAMLCCDTAPNSCTVSHGVSDMSAVVHGVKAAARSRLTDISGFHISSGPTRTGLKQVYSYVARQYIARQGGTRQREVHRSTV